MDTIAHKATAMRPVSPNETPDYSIEEIVLDLTQHTASAEYLRLRDIFMEAFTDVDLEVKRSTLQ